MVHYKIYNKSVDLLFDVFCAAIRVPQWGSREKMKERPRLLTDLYEEICQGRSFIGESGKIQNIHFPSIRYFAYFITKCVLTRKVANKLSSCVVGMTYGAHHGPSNRPAGVPGVPAAPAREDRLCPKGRLRQQPAGDSIEEGRSRAMKTKAHQRLFRRKWAGPDKRDRGEGRE
jgi:hypothetical protein